MPTSETLAANESLIPSPVFVYRRRERILATVLDAVLEVGRQRDGEPAPAVRVDRSDGARLIVTPINDVEVSRSHVALKPEENGQITVINLSRTLPVRISPHETLQPGESTLVAAPVLVLFGEFAVRVDPPEEEDELQLQALPERTMAPGQGVAAEVPVFSKDLMLSAGSTLDESSLLKWLETVMGVFQSAASSRDFPEQAAAAVVRIVGLDTAAMIRLEDARWQVEALHSQASSETQQAWAPSQTLLAKVRSERRTFRHVPTTVDTDTPRSLQDVTALVAAPILNGEGEVIGALYGDRRSGNQAVGIPEITPFETKLVELLATGIATGLARLEEEQAALAARVQFEQFFTPQLAEQLERDPELLEGRDAEVTVLFADIRGFSRISERLGPARTMAWIQDTMGVLSECVLEHHGVLVDYIGDEIMAMWGAPAPQADHAASACRAAREMGERLREINQRWQQELGAEVRLGVGLNSGIARVGNTGSPQKFKYGPLGGVVNIASRVQGATKYLGADCLVTQATLEALPDDLTARRLARVRVVNIEHPVDLFELMSHPPADWPERCQRYEAALLALETEDLPQAQTLVEQLKLDYSEDRAVAALQLRVEESLQSQSPGNTSIWHLPGK